MAQKLAEQFFSDDLNQTDFGRLYSNMPSVRYEPSTLEELAAILKQENALGRRVTIRNTGHSVNGQTLTNATQISIGKIKKIVFDKDSLEVTVSAGNSWHEMFEATEFPKYCPPLFPQNPDQQIHVSGISAVGGIGIYSSGVGGLWNHIKKLTLVTMTGEIVRCSPQHEPELFYYSLGGFGRIGVIGQVTMSVAPSKSDTLIMALIHHNVDLAGQHLKKLAQRDDINGIIFQQQLTRTYLLKKLGVAPVAVIAIKECQKGENIEKSIAMLKKACQPDLSLYVFPDHDHGFEFTLHHKTMSKNELVYYYPKNKDHQLMMLHPWSDFALPFHAFTEFADHAGELLVRSGIAPYLTHESVFNDHFSFDWFGAYVFRNVSAPENKFPLTYELQNAGEHSVVFGIQPAIPRELLSSSLEVTQELTELVYKLGGKRLLSGVHTLTRRQVEQQFGQETIETWQRIKDQTDPKHLLNIGVIEHLD